MCGIIAYMGQDPVDEDVIRLALNSMHRRGPDSSGIWSEGSSTIGHCRLAIQDLDPRSIQPMHSLSNRYAIAFNGEIYNFRLLRKDLQSRGVQFRTTSDTEVLLALFALDGANFLSKLEGMFAFVIWDKHEKVGFIARDPYGIKPLYIGKTNKGLLIGSQVQALLATGLIKTTPDALGQAGFWLLGSVPEPHTWYKDIQALPAGTYSWVTVNGQASAPRSWFDISEAWRNASTESEHWSDSEIQRHVSQALRDSVERHLVSDVPVGIFLSGGIDSSAVAGLMKDAGARDIEGITIAFDEFAGTHDDEAPVAAEVAALYGIRHHVRRVTKEEFFEDLPRILEAMDQPSIDGINSWYASKAVAERGLKVVMSGIGGDELFHGYPSFKQLPRLVERWSKLSRVPGAMPFGILAGKLQATRTGNSRWEHAAKWARTIEGAWWMRRSIHSPGSLPGLMGADLAREVMEMLADQDWETLFSPAADAPSLSMSVGLLESSMYLRNQLLRDSDWASMDHSVELRTPLVDARLLTQLSGMFPRFGSLPNKALLANAPSQPLPRHIVQRKKTGFGIPVGRWQNATSGSSKNSQDSGAWAKTVAHAYQERNSQCVRSLA